jgi:hypothetical protein
VVRERESSASVLAVPTLGIRARFVRDVTVVAEGVLVVASGVMALGGSSGGEVTE